MRTTDVETLFSSSATRRKSGSVCIAVSLYNYAKYLEECLDSVATQDLRELELIIVDDASTDDESAQLAVDWSTRNRSRFQSIQVLRHKSNSGLAQARNTGFAHSRSDLVFVLDADNCIFPSAIGKLRRSLLASEAAACYSQLQIFDGRKDIGFADYFSRDLLSDGPYVDAMALVRKSAWQAVGGYSHIEGGWEDFDFWCKLVDARLEAIFLPEILCRYRFHKTSMLQTDSLEAASRLMNIMSLRHPWVAFD